MFTLDLKSGAAGPVRNIWNGTGASAPEGPHIYHRDGYYYLLIAEGGTGAGHMVSMARSKSIDGPYTSNPNNPVLTNANSTSYFQNLGHADLFQDRRGKWWAVALSVREGVVGSYPMGRETVMTPVTWERGQWPVFEPVTGQMSGWWLDEEDVPRRGEGSLVTAGDDVHFIPGEGFKPEFVHWRFPVPGSYVVSPKGHEGSLQLVSSESNLTGHDGRSAEPKGQTFTGRRQVDSFFKFGVTFDVKELQVPEQEVGVTVFLDQVCLPSFLFRDPNPFPCCLERLAADCSSSTTTISASSSPPTLVLLSSASVASPPCPHSSPPQSPRSLFPALGASRRLSSSLSRSVCRISHTTHSPQALSASRV